MAARERVDAADDPAAVAWREHGGELLAFARRRLPEPADAEDAVQSALANLAATDANVRDVRAMAFAVLRRRIADCLRRRAADARREERLAAEAELRGATPGFNDDGFRAAGVSSWSLDPALAAQSAEFWADFARCVDELPTKQRQAFCLREIDGEPTEAVCELLSVSPTALWGLIHRARLRLRDGLGHHFERTRGAEKGKRR